MITFYNIVNKDDPHNRIVETWGLFKRNGSSYVDTLSGADQSEYSCWLRKPKHYNGTTHDFAAILPTEHTLVNNPDFSETVNMGRLKLCIRDPMHRYCSALVMIPFDLHIRAAKHSLMEPYYHNGGKQEIMQDYPHESNSYRIRYLYQFREWIRSLSHTLFMPAGSGDPVFEYTFGENHLDPVLSQVALMPFLKPYTQIHFIDLKVWTEFTTDRLGIGEERDEVERWNTPKLEGKRNEIAEPGRTLFKVLQKELPDSYTRDTRAIDTPRNWRPTFEEWLEPEMMLYNFFKNNPIVETGSSEIAELQRILVHLLEDPFFLVRNWSVFKNYTCPQVLEVLPSELRAAIVNCESKVLQYKKEMHLKRHVK